MLRVRDEVPGGTGTLYRFILDIGHWSVPNSLAPLPQVAGGVAAAWFAGKARLREVGAEVGLKTEV